MSAIDRLAVGPVVAALTAAAALGLRRLGLPSENAVFAWLGPIATGFLVVVVGDFAGYWRHRAQHTPWLWPAHAVHHSDRRLTWTSLDRMHPLDRLGTAMDTFVLTALGFPVWAIALNNMVRHYYGYAIHTDAPWTFGKASLLLNSPAMHRWHHARHITSGCNFATVFAVWDRLFGTFHQPGPCDAPLGVEEDLGEGAAAQYAYPFRVWWAALRRRRAEPVTP
jgi:sterol desaturase/sphingolipid hydroxylase (fatty acid hydroxylase superfamily)